MLEEKCREKVLDGHRGGKSRQACKVDVASGDKAPLIDATQTKPAKG
jgi:hypothetical protein